MVRSRGAAYARVRPIHVRIRYLTSRLTGKISETRTWKTFLLNFCFSLGFMTQLKSIHRQEIYSTMKKGKRNNSDYLRNLRFAFSQASCLWNYHHKPWLDEFDLVLLGQLSFSFNRVLFPLSLHMHENISNFIWSWYERITFRKWLLFEYNPGCDGHSLYYFTELSAAKLSILKENTKM